MKKNKILKISILILSIVAIFLVIGITYAYFGVNRKGNEDNILASSCFNLELTANNILSEGNVPMTDEDAKKITPYTFTIKNTCGISAEVGINLDILKTTNATLSNYKVSMSNGVILAPTLIDNLEADDISNNDTLLTKKLASVYVAGKSEKTLELRLWMKDSVGVGEGENEIIESKISLTATAIPIEFTAVQEKIIADNGGVLKIRGKKNVNFDEIAPYYIYSSTMETMTEMQSEPGKTYYYSDTYSFDKKGLYTLVNPKLDYLNDDMKDKYVCDTGDKTCQIMYKITNYKYHEGDIYIYDIYEESSIFSFGVKDSILVAKEYEVDDEGYFNLINPVKSSEVNESLVGYYFFDDFGSENGWAVYKIKEIEISENQEDLYIEKITENNTISINSNNDKKVGKSFKFDKTTGTYSLNDILDSVTFSRDYIDYYYCNNNTTSCNTIYQIQEVNDSTLSKVNTRSSIKNENKIVLSDVQYALDYNYDLIDGEKYSKKEIGYEKNDSSLYVAQDDFGDTYYFRGGNDWNNLYFAGYYWNIVRINGDGTLRIIYRGSSPTSSGSVAMAENNIFNYGQKDFSSVTYLGYMYGGDFFTNANNSAIKDTLESWYENQMLSNDKYIADSVFCNDRSQKGELDIYNGFNSYERLANEKEKAPTFKCSQKNDRFTVQNSYGNQGNKYPIGLLTADEAMFAGMNSRTDSKYNYLNVSSTFWTMTPGWYSNLPYIFCIKSSKLGSINVDLKTKSGIRPVINLKGNVILSGTGTLEDPYRVEGLQTE